MKIAASKGRHFHLYRIKQKCLPKAEQNARLYFLTIHFVANGIAVF